MCRHRGTYAYHFWMREMVPVRRGGGDQYLHRRPPAYREAVRRKIAAYHRYLQLGLIAQGLLQYLALKCPDLVWRSFGSWLRTIRPDVPPSEMVTASALRNTLPYFLASSGPWSIFTNFLWPRIDPGRAEGARLVA